MNLTTQCPQCKTAFQASLEELQLRKGYIRCINCAHIFDGYDAVVSTADAVAPVPATKAAPMPIPAFTPASIPAPIPIPTSTASPIPEHTSTTLVAPAHSSVVSSPPSVVRHRPDTSKAADEPVFHLGKVIVSGDTGPVFELGGNAPAEPVTQPAIVHSRSVQEIGRAHV